MLDKLPQWDECRNAVEAKEATALQNFIYEQEPAGREAVIEFRLQLLAAINEEN